MNKCVCVRRVLVDLCCSRNTPPPVYVAVALLCVTNPPKLERTAHRLATNKNETLKLASKKGRQTQEKDHKTQHERKTSTVQEKNSCHLTHRKEMNLLLYACGRCDILSSPRACAAWKPFGSPPAQNILPSALKTQIRMSERRCNMYAASAMPVWMCSLMALFAAGLFSVTYAIPSLTSNLHSSLDHSSSE